MCVQLPHLTGVQGQRLWTPEEATDTARNGIWRRISPQSFPIHCFEPIPTVDEVDPFWYHNVTLEGTLLGCTQNAGGNIKACYDCLVAQGDWRDLSAKRYLRCLEWAVGVSAPFTRHLFSLLMQPHIYVNDLSYAQLAHLAQPQYRTVAQIAAGYCGDARLVAK